LFAPSHAASPDLRKTLSGEAPRAAAMTMQSLGSKAADRKGAAPRRALGEPALSEKERETLARRERERADQREIFEARREEILAAHPGKHIAVCNGEVFAADTALGAAQWAAQNHLGRGAFYYTARLKGQTDEEAYLAEIARSERETDLQQEIFEARREEILAAHPGKHIAVCNGEVLVADSEQGAADAAMRKHPGRASFFYSPGYTCVTVF